MEFNKEAREVQQVLHKVIVEHGFRKSIPLIVKGIEAALRTAYMYGFSEGYALAIEREEPDS